MEVNYNYNNGTILKFLRKVLNEINKEYVDSGMRTGFLLKRYIEKYKTDDEFGPQHVLLCMLKDIGLFYMDGEVPSDDPAAAAASSFTFLEHCSPLGVAARPLLFYKAKYIETQSNPDYDLGLLMTLLNQVIIYIYQSYNLEEIEDCLKIDKKRGLYKPEHVKRVLKLLKDEPDIFEKLTSESNLYVYETSKYISQAGYTDEQLEGFIDTTSFAFEFHNHETLAHTVTTAEIAYDLALKARLTKDTADIIKLAARVHDIGKIRVPREILCFPGRLEGEMLDEMQRHVVYTREIIENSFSYKIVDIASNHHEKLDGSGYPRGLNAVNLTSADKVIAIADICSALYCKRSYKAAFDDEKIKSILLGDAENGKLDLRIVNHLINNYEEIMQHAKEKEEEVLTKYNNMKEEYEALAHSQALKHFFDFGYEEETKNTIEDTQGEQEEIVYVDENGNVIEDYNPEEYEDTQEEQEEIVYDDLTEEQSSEFVVPDNEYQEDDLYSEDTEEFLEELSEEEKKALEYEEELVDELLDGDDKNVEPAKPFDQFEDFQDNQESLDDDEFSKYMNQLDDKQLDDEMDDYVNNLESVEEEEIVYVDEDGNIIEDYQPEDIVEDTLTEEPEQTEEEIEEALRIQKEKDEYNAYLEKLLSGIESEIDSLENALEEDEAEENLDNSNEESDEDVFEGEEDEESTEPTEDDEFEKYINSL